MSKWEVFRVFINAKEIFVISKNRHARCTSVRRFSSNSRIKISLIYKKLL